MMPISFFVSRLGITDLIIYKFIIKIMIYANLIKIFDFEIFIISIISKFFYNFEIFIIFSSLKDLSKYVIIFGNVTRINLFIIARRKTYFIFLYISYIEDIGDIILI
jgi:hypothetical protein